MNNVYLPIDHVVDGVYISGWRATQYADSLRAANIVSVLKLYDGTPYFPADFNVCENGIDDGAPVPLGALERGTQFICQEVESGKSVLVICGAGISRSSTFVLAYLLKQKYDLRDAYALLKRTHPQAQPHPELWQSLITYYGLSYRLNDVMGWLG